MRNVPKGLRAALCLAMLALIGGCARQPILPTPPIIEGWDYSELPVTYDPRTLFQYMDGKASVYLDYGFVRLDHVQFGRPGSTAVIDVDVYDMGTPRGAFGMYSYERGDDLPRHYRKRLGYMIDSARFFWKGRYYVTITSPEISPDTIAAVKSLSLYLEKSVPGDSQTLPLLATFPAEGKVHESEQYFATNLMGYQFMGEGFLATYEEKGNRFKLFLSPKESPETAAEAFRQLKESLRDYGEVLGDVAGVGESAFQAKDNYVGTWLVALSGEHIVGAVSFHDETSTRTLLALLCRNSSRSVPQSVARREGRPEGEE